MEEEELEVVEGIGGGGGGGGGGAAIETVTEELEGSIAS